MQSPYSQRKRLVHSTAANVNHYTTCTELCKVVVDQALIQHFIKSDCYCIFRRNTCIEDHLRIYKIHPRNKKAADYRINDDRTAHGKYHLERDFILPEYNAGNLKVNVYPFHNVALFNQSVDEYFVNNMKLLEPDVRRSLFRSEIPIYTKVRDAVPTLFGYHGQAANCLIADGCHLFGKAENSVIFREVDIEDGAEVRDSIIMQGSKIGAGASIRYCILDKNVTIRPGTKLLGSIDHPLVVDKGDTV